MWKIYVSDFSVKKKVLQSKNTIKNPVKLKDNPMFVFLVANCSHVDYSG